MQLQPRTAPGVEVPAWSPKLTAHSPHPLSSCSCMQDCSVLNKPRYNMMYQASAGERSQCGQLKAAI